MKPIGREAAGIIQAALVEQKMLDGDGRLQPAFDPKRPDFKVELPEGQKDLAPAVVDLLASFQIERHVRRARDEGTNRLRKEVTLTPEFAELRKRIKPKTTYTSGDYRHWPILRDTLRFTGLPPSSVCVPAKSAGCVSKIWI